MKAKFVLQTLCISFLLCFLTNAQETEPQGNQNTLNASTSLENGKTFSIPFEPAQFHPFGFVFGMGEPRREFLGAVDMRSSGLWINNFTDRSWPGIRYRCDLSKTCKMQEGGVRGYTWIEGYELDKKSPPSSGLLMKERVDFGGVTLPSADVFILYLPSPYVPTYRREGALGLNFRRSNPEIPTFFESIKAAGLVDKSIFSMYIDSRNSGELFFGGYDTKRAESEFQYAKWQEDQDPTLPGFSLQAKAVGYGNDVFSDKYTVVIDMEYGDIMIPEWIINRIDREESSRGLSEEVHACKSLSIFQDIVIEFEGLTLRIPPAAYIRYKDAWTYGNKDCSRSLVKTDESKPRIILGLPFLRFFYTVFNLEEKTIGFSKMVSLEESYPFGKDAKDPDARKDPQADFEPEVYYDPDQTGEPYYLPLKVGGVLAVLVIAKFCVMLYFIIRAWKRPEGSDENLVSPKIHVGNQEDSHQESPNIDVGKITIEEEKFYA